MLIINVNYRQVTGLSLTLYYKLIRYHYTEFERLEARDGLIYSRL